MVRRYEEPIEVREGAREDLTPGLGGVAGLGPDAFVWRGRLYVVRAVLDRWQERRRAGVMGSGPVRGGVEAPCSQGQSRSGPRATVRHGVGP